MFYWFVHTLVLPDLSLPYLTPSFKVFSSLSSGKTPPKFSQCHHPQPQLNTTMPRSRCLPLRSTTECHLHHFCLCYTSFNPSVVVSVRIHRTCHGHRSHCSHGFVPPRRFLPRTGTTWRCKLLINKAVMINNLVLAFNMVHSSSLYHSSFMIFLYLW